jgi:hypothetical protein
VKVKILCGPENEWKKNKIEILLVLTNDRKNPDQTEATQRPEF